MGPEARSPAPSERRRSFWRAVALAGAVALLSPLSSSLLGPVAMAGIPAGVGLLAFQRRRRASVVLGLGLLVAIFAGALSDPPSMWYVERAWGLLLAGGFVIVTALLPRWSLFTRSVLSLAIAGAVVLGSAVLNPGLVGELDWRIAGQFQRASSMLVLEGEMGAAIGEAVRRVSTIVRAVYPALLGLASLCALAIASYVLKRMEGVDRALSPLRRFRFSDHMAWLLILGLALLILPLGAWAVRSGWNVTTFMGGLYALRGAAVLAWVGTSVITSGWSIALWIVAALLFYPITLGAALVLGLSDTWLDLRARLGVQAGDE